MPLMFACTILTAGCGPFRSRVELSHHMTQSQVPTEASEKRRDRQILGALKQAAPLTRTPQMYSARGRSPGLTSGYNSDV